MVLSAMAGMDSAYLPTGEKPELPDLKKLSLILFQLYQKGLLKWEDDNYIPRAEIGSLFRNIRFAKKELQIYGRNENSPLLCFWNECPVLVEHSENDRDKIKVLGLQKGDLIIELSERGILPEENTKQMGAAFEANEEDIWAGFLKTCPRLVQNGEIRYEVLENLFENQDMLTAAITVFERDNPENLYVILVLHCEMFDSLALTDGDTVRIKYYTSDILQELL